MNLRPIQRLRGLSAPELMPESRLPACVFGKPNCGVFARLNASRRNCAEYFAE